MGESRKYNQFNIDDVTHIIEDAMETIIAGNAYQPEEVMNWTDKVVKSCLSILINYRKKYKYIVTAVIMQKNGAALHTASSCFWNGNTDGSCTVNWENESMYCIASVHFFAL